MALFKTSLDRLQRMELADLLEQSEGSSCELSNPETRRVLIVGRIDSFDGSALKVVSSDGFAMPSIVYNTRLMLRFRIGTDFSAVLYGTISGSCNAFWKLDNITHYFEEETRSFFRQPLRTQCLILPIVEPAEVPEGEDAPPPPEPHECTTINISLTGIQLRSPVLYRKGDLIRVHELILRPEDKRKHDFLCNTCWVTQDPGGQFRLGCRFEGLDRREQDRLCETIFQMQRKDIKRGRY